MVHHPPSARPLTRSSTLTNTPPAPAPGPAPFTPEDFDEPCEDCGAPAGFYCRPGCDTGFTAEDARAQNAART